MRKTLHLCLSSHDEVMYRSEEDLIMGFNSLALAVLDTGSRLLGEGFIPTHHHAAVQTDDLHGLRRRSRYTYCRFFNAKYSRRGSLGERLAFTMCVDGLYHLQTLLNYVLRQGLHHGLASTPFGYEHCSANCIFRKELGKTAEPPLLAKQDQYIYLPEHKQLPEGYRMAKNGLILREDIIDSAYVEEIYISPRNFLFQMNKMTDDKTIQEQKDENELAPVTLEAIERGVPEFDIRAALIQEQGRVNRNILTDLELCSHIDNNILPREFKDFEQRTIYRLPYYRRAEIGNALLKEAQSCFGTKSGSIFSNKRTSPAQIRRCLALNYEG